MSSPKGGLSFPLSPGYTAEAKASNTKKPAWPGNGSRKGVSIMSERHFERLEERDLEELGSFQQSTSPQNGIRVTTDIEAF